MFRTVPLSIIRSFSLYTQQWYMSANLYNIYHFCVYSEKLLMMDRGTVRNMQSFIPKINLSNQCIQYQTRDFMKTASLRSTQIARNLNSLGTACSLFNNDSAPWTLISVANIYTLIIFMTDPLFFFFQNKMNLTNFADKMLCYLLVTRSINASFITVLYRVKENLIFM